MHLVSMILRANNTTGGCENCRTCVHQLRCTMESACNLFLGDNKHNINVVQSIGWYIPFVPFLGTQRVHDIYCWQSRVINIFVNRFTVHGYTMAAVGMYQQSLRRSATVTGINCPTTHTIRHFFPLWRKTEEIIVRTV